MKIRSCVGITKPSLLLVHSELPALTFHKTKLTWTSTLRFPSNYERTSGSVTRFHCNVAGRTGASTSVSSSSSKSNTVHLSRKQVKPSSLYSRPSLSNMKKERIANRAKERIDFLHKLGLTIEDINNYPLVLGCSVKKNMIPVLDYLGKLGVRKSTFTEFLRRYPQVLHASVVVDLAPVVKYLQGLDIKPNDIPRVLEKYPEVLGFKLEGTMSTSVAYLVGIGVSRREVGGVLTKYPEILGMRVGRVIKPFVEYLEGLGIPRLAIARLIEKRPHILGFGLEERVKPNLASLLEFNVRKASLPSIVAQYPEIIGIDLKPKLLGQRSLIQSIIDLEPEDFGTVVEKMPQIVSLSNTSMVKHADFLKGCGFSLQQRPLDDLVAFPAFFTYGLESTIKPRDKIVAKKGFKCSLSWLLNCSDEKFKDRLNYDTIEMEEMETMPSFDMNSLMEPRSDESDSDYEEDSDDEYA
ncbi:hypothetical protein E1A91_A08G081700v1 [Gossypium mustelinum]|uniref:Transcription termination factor MTERF4, chloroplastic n=1 Tax=Gossypium mustelinum TaxID=34275 RepID=A0A5D2Y689_GOSMU|nr:hypothetical protein E1A91_A08G081700v1 [Gossypium mustelinum]TYJ21723.1 hypothetical protein E1A91_A08G081700v1 [Gossypium mustelinum]